jgi:hypothetical protein
MVQREAPTSVFCLTLKHPPGFAFGLTQRAQSGLSPFAAGTAIAESQFETRRVVAFPEKEINSPGFGDSGNDATPNAFSSDGMKPNFQALGGHY